MLGFYNYTVVLTYIGMFMGFTGILLASCSDWKSALLCLMIAGFCDMFDGRIASTMERTVQEKRFGIQIDSLSDLVCFGILPATIVCSAVPNNLFIYLAAGMYVLAALIRLAWFNVDEEKRQNESDEPREYYLGLPVTTAALLFPLFLGVRELCNWPLTVVGAALLLCVGIAFLTPFHLKKPHIFGKIIMLLCGCAEVAILLMGVNL